MALAVMAAARAAAAVALVSALQGLMRAAAAMRVEAAAAAVRTGKSARPCLPEILLAFSAGRVAMVTAQATAAAVVPAAMVRS